ncbi:MAG: hypothetical protein AAF602_06090 [Myxococcota bacterium]
MKRARYSVRLPVTPPEARAQVRHRADRTEDSLVRWRSVAAGRRRAYELAQWVAAEQARRRRRRWLRGLRGVLATMMVFALTVGAVAVQSGPDAEARAPGVVMSEDAAPALASGVLTAEDAVLVATVGAPRSSFFPPEIEPAERLRAPADEALGTTEPLGPPSPSIVGVDEASVSQWSDDDYQWVQFEVETQEPTWIRWTDPSGATPIADMPCAFPTPDAHECRAGRSHWRLAHALKDGAPAGTWTIEACVGDVCEFVDEVEIGLG